MCRNCRDTGIHTLPAAPPDEDGEYSQGHVLAWIEFMRRVGEVIRVTPCLCKVGRRLRGGES